jgi:branched-chain amino acid transport system substrate-binding protein
VAKLRRPARLSVAALLVLILVAAACSDDKKTSAGSSGSGNAGTTETTAPTPKGTPINIGLVGSFTGSQSSSSRQGETVGPAWERYINEQLGGINGHPVKVITADDGGDSAKAQAAEKKLVDQDKVVAIIVSSDNFVPAFDDDAVAKNVALISGSANSTDWYTKPGLFPTPTDVLSGLAGQALVAQQFGHATKFANLYCSEVAACAQADPILKGALEKANVGFTSIAVSATATSYTAECLQLKNDGVDFAQLNFSAEAATKFVQDCQQQGYNPTWGSSAQAVGKGFKDLENFTMFGPAYVFPSVADNPEVEKFRGAMEKYAKDDDWAEGTGSFTWAGLEMLHKALSTITTSDPTGATVLAAMKSIKSEDLGGLLPNKVTYDPPISFGGLPCFFVIGVKDGETLAPNGLKPICPPAG